MVAIKTVDLGSFDGATQDLLMSEERIMNALVHPNIVRLFQVGLLVLGVKTGHSRRCVYRLTPWAHPSVAALSSYHKIGGGASTIDVLFRVDESRERRHVLDRCPAGAFLSRAGHKIQAPMHRGVHLA